MTINYVVVPQWQGSGSSRAMQLVDGAESIRGDLPFASTRTVDVPLEAGDHQGSGVHRLSSLLLVKERALRTYAAHPVGEGAVASEGAVADESDAPTFVTIGGDCGVELAAIEHVNGSAPAIVWIDAHPDLNTPESSKSGAFTGMVLRTLLGDGPAGLVPAHPVAADHVILVGVRSADDEEDAYIQDAGIRSIGVIEFSTEAVLEAIAATGASSVYLHIDLDVLDPADFAGLGSPVPFGIAPASLAQTIRAVVAKYPLAGAGITEFAPASLEQAADDLPTILRLIGAITSAR